MAKERMKVLNGLVLTVCLAIELYCQTWDRLASISGMFLIFKYILLVVFVFKASPSKRDSFADLVAWGLFVVSLGAILCLRHEPGNSAVYFKILTLANYLFYSTLFLFSYYSLGTSFGLIPEERTIRTTKAYTIARHPIYYFSSLLVLNFLATNLSLKNFICFLILTLCSFFRALKEESLLNANDEYAEYRKKTPFITLTGLSLALPALIAFPLNAQHFEAQKKQDPVTVYSDVQFYSINPLEFDDWSSIFIANHLLVDLIQGQNHSRKSACKISSNACLDKSCNRKRVELACETLKGCSGETITNEIIQNEISEILTKKNWILPGFKQCLSKGKVCLEFNGLQNIEERLNSIYLRLGWSQFDSKKLNSFFGYGTHCAKISSIANKTDVIILESKSNFPDIHFKTKLQESFDVSYIAPINARANVAKIKINTPIAYYSVSNPKFVFKKLPWNYATTTSLIKKHLMKFDFIFKNELPFQVVPKGNELSTNSSVPNKVQYLYKLPNYINDCESLKKELNKNWEIERHSAKAECADLNTTIQDIVLKGKKWDGFLSPLSPGAPYLSSLHDQYFSPDSNDAWIKNQHDTISYSLIGVGRTNLYVNRKKICDVRDNYLGLSNLHISDFVFCD